MYLKLVVEEGFPRLAPFEHLFQDIRVLFQNTPAPRGEFGSSSYQPLSSTPDLIRSSEEPAFREPHAMDRMAIYHCERLVNIKDAMSCCMDVVREGAFRDRSTSLDLSAYI